MPNSLSMHVVAGGITKAEVTAKINAHAALPFIHPHRRMPPQKYEYLLIRRLNNAEQTHLIPFHS